MNPLSAPLAHQRIRDLQHAADRARLARSAHDVRPHLRRTRRAR